MKLLPTFFLILPFALSAEMILHEPFDLELNEDDARLKTHNGWQHSFEYAGESDAMVREGAVHSGVSPFEDKGYCIQASSTKTSAYKKLPGTLNGKTVYFSYVVNSFKRGNFSGLRFRSKKGMPVAVGLTEEGFFGSVFGKDEKSTGEGETNTRYMVIGKLETSDDGHEVKLSFSYYDSVKDIPDNVPNQWAVELKAKTGPQEWDGVEFRSASGNTAFDDLRISTEWTDVAGT
jgi:hypothetical protein